MPSDPIWVVNTPFFCDNGKTAEMQESGHGDGISPGFRPAQSILSEVLFISEHSESVLGSRLVSKLA